MSSIIINGVTFDGDSISIKNGNIVVDGNKVSVDSKKIDIVIQGHVENVVVDSCDSLRIIGNVLGVSTKSGDVNIVGNVISHVNGNDIIRTVSGDVTISGDMTGNVTSTSGDVKARSITGNVKTVSGDISGR